MKRIIDVSVFRFLLRKYSLKTLLLCILSFLQIPSIAQSPADNWFFGTNAGITFTGGTPTVVGGGMINSAEGVSSISNSAGDLLFYTDGVTVYNQNNLSMSNGTGLLGGSSSSQSAVAIRKPGSNNFYYLFTADQDAGSDGVRYSVIDMNLSSGLGDVVAGQKNLLLLAPATEKLTAVRHCNKIDNWVIAHDWGTNQFYAWLVTSAGVSASPIISSVGAIHDQSVIGCMKVAPDGSKLALAIYDQGGQHTVQVFDFNASTGQVSNPFTQNLSGSAYGIEFSPNGRYLYYTSAPSQASATIGINQIDLCAGSSANILASATPVGSASDGFIRTLQLGPDRKLYFSRFGQPWLGVIANPDLAAPACGFQLNGVSLGSGICRAGLPNFNQSFFNSVYEFDASSVCLTASFSAQEILDNSTCLNPITSMNWNFGEPGSGAANTSTSVTPNHTYASPGTYVVRLILNYPCRVDTIFKSVNIQCGLQVTMSNQSICPGQCVNLQANVTGGTAPYSWSWTGVSATTAGPVNVCPINTTTYTATVTDAVGLTASVNAVVTVNSLPNATVAVTPVSCNGLSNGGASITIAGGPYSFQWNTNPAQISNVLSNVPSGVYTATITSLAGCQKLVTANVVQPSALTHNINFLNSSCGLANGSATMIGSGGTMPYSYLWNTFPIQTGPTATGLVAGSYHVDLTDSHGCIESADVVISDQISHSAYIDIIQGITCVGGSNGSLTAICTSGTGPFTFLWSNGQTSQIATGLSAGTHSVQVTDMFNCSLTYTYTLSDPPALGIQVDVTNTVCGLQNGSASLVLTGGSAPFTVNWDSSPGQNVLNIGNLQSGSHSVNITDQFGCSYTSSFVVNITPVPNLQISPNQFINCIGSNSGSLTANLSGGTPPYAYSWSNGSTSATILNLGPATYTCTITDASGCITNAAYQLIDPSPININPIVVPSSCGLSNGSISLILTGGSAPYQYSWVSGQSTSSITGLSPGIYTVNVTDALGCSKQSVFNVNVVGGPSISLLSFSDVLCYGEHNGAVELSISGGSPPFLIDWSDGGSGAIRNDLSPGNNLVTVTDVFGCVNQFSITIDQPPPLVATWNLTEERCDWSNGIAEILVTGGIGSFTFIWSNGQIGQPFYFQPGGTPGNVVGGQTGEGLYSLSAGAIGVLVTDGNGCQVTFDTIVPGNGGITASIIEISSVSCYGLSDGELQVQVIGGESPFTYQWSNGDVNAISSNLSSGDYFVNITDNLGCQAVSSYTLYEIPSISVNPTISSSTCGASNGEIEIEIQGGNAPYQIAWSNGQSGIEATMLSSGNYSATITDASGCSLVETFAVVDIGGPSLSLSSSTDASCNGLSDGSALTVANGGVLPYTILWSDGATSLSRTNLSAGNYSLTVTDASGCSSQLSIPISEPPVISATWILSPSTCSLPNGSAEVSVTGGTGAFSYAWSSGETTTTIGSQPAGNVSVVVTDANSCQQTFNNAIIGSGGITSTIDIVTAITCNGVSDGELDVSVLGGLAPFSYVWSTGATTSSISTLNAGNYSVLVTDASGCISNSSINLSAPAALSASSSSVSSTCGLANGSISVLVSGGLAPYQVVWSSGQTGLLASSLASGSYSATITDASGCSLVETFAVVDIGGPSLSLSSSTDASCNGLSDGSALIVANGGVLPYTILWSDGATSLSRTNLSAGNYSLTVTDASGCGSQLSVVINEPQPITASWNYQAESCASGNGSASIVVAGGQTPYSYLWMDGTTLSSIQSQSAGNVSVVVSDASACSVTFSGTISAIPATSASISVSSAVTCHDSSDATIQIISSLPVQVTWADGGNSNVRSNVAPGNYSAYIVDDVGCFDTLSVSVLNPPAITAAISTSNATCSANDGSAQIVYAGGTGSLSVQWMNGSTVSSISNLGFGSVSAVVTDNNGCVLNVTSLIGTISPLNIDTILVVNPSCVGASDAVASMQISGNTGLVNATWSNGAAGIQASNLSSGNYTLTVTDASGCMTWRDFQVTDPSPMTVQVSTLDATCYGSSNGQANISVSGGTGPYSVLWTDALVTFNRSDLSAGNYSITIQDALGCQAIENAVVGQADSLAGSVFTQPATCGTASGSAVISLTGGTLPYFYMWNNASTTNQASGLAPGTANVLATDANGCQKNFAAQITSAPSASVQLNVNQQVSCFGGANAEVEISSSSPVTALWNDGNTNLIRSNLIAATYTAYTVDAGGCRDTLVVTLSQPDALAATFAVSSATCLAADGSASVSVSGGTIPYAYSWSNGGLTNVISGVSTGLLDLQITDANACVLSVSTEIQSINPIAIDTIIVSNASCFGISDGAAIAQISGATGTAVYSWSNGATSNSLQNLAAATYNLQVIDQAGCNAAKSFTVDAPSALQVSVMHEDITCNGLSNGVATAFVIGGTMPYTYSWNGITGNDVATSLPAGTINLIVTDDNNCSTQQTIEITQPQPLMVMIDVQTSTCGLANGTLDSEVSGGTMPYQYSWSTGAASTLLNGLLPGTYTLNVTDANGCEGGLTKSFFDVGPPSIQLVTAADIACFGGSDGSVEVAVFGGTGNLSVVWTSGESGNVLTNLPIGNYAATVTDVLGCTANFTHTLTQPEAIEANFQTSDVLCFGGYSGHIVSHITGGVPIYTTEIYVLGGTTPQLANNLNANVYTVVISDANGCLLMDTLTISEPSELSIQSNSTDVLCFGGTDGTAEAVASGGTSPYVYQWSNGATSSQIDSLPRATYIVTITDSNQCQKTESIFIDQPDLLQVFITGVDEICTNEEVSFSNYGIGGFGDYTIQWMTGSTLETISFQSDSSMLVSVTLVDENQCQAIASHALQVHALPVIELTPMSSTSCAGECVQVQCVPVDGGIYTWSNGLGAVANGRLVSFCFEEEGSIALNLSVIDVHGCRNTATFSDYFTIYPLPTASFTVSDSNIPLLDAFIHFTNTSQNAVSSLWNFDERIEGEESTNTSASYQFTEIGSYPVTLKVVNEYGCADLAIRWIQVKEDFAVYLPNAFTPNHDGLNDGFIPKGIGYEIQNYRFEIFDRWGKTVFVTNEPSKAWDGSHELNPGSEQLTNEVFVWKLQLEDFQGQIHDFSGSVTLVR